MKLFIEKLLTDGPVSSRCGYVNLVFWKLGNPDNFVVPRNNRGQLFFAKIVLLNGSRYRCFLLFDDEITIIVHF